MGSLSLNRKIFNRVIFMPFQMRYIRFKGPVGTTLYNFIDPFFYFNDVNSSFSMNIYLNGLNGSPTTFLSDGIDWYNSSASEIVNDYIIPLDAIFELESSSNIRVGLDLGGNAEDYYQGKTSIKKQNLNILKSSNYSPIEQSVYIFKSAVNNTLSSIFNYAQFEDYSEVLGIYYEGSLSGQNISFGSDGSGWTDFLTFENRNNYVIPANSLIILSLNSDKNITVGGGAIIQKYYSGKLTSKVFSPDNLTDLQLWLKADAGVITQTITPTYISEILIENSGTTTSNGSYTRSSGGTTQFDGPNGNYIYFDGSNWYLYDDSAGYETYVNYGSSLDAEAWNIENGNSPAPTATNTTSSSTPFQGVTSWNDQSGNSRNFTKSITYTGYPTYSNNAVLFTANNTYNDSNASILALPSNDLNFTTPYTLIVLAHAGPNNSCIFSKSNDDPKRRKYQISINGGIIYSLESTLGEDTNISYDTGTGDDINVKRLIVAQYSSNTSGLVRYNGTQVAIGDGSGSSGYGIDETNTASVFIGASAFSEGTGYNPDASTEMYVYEILFYNRALSLFEIEKIENYLNNKYAMICGLKNTNKLVEINGFGPISRVFNNIAFDYTSFANNCSSLGLDTTTMLKNLGGVDFNYKYVVIRAKTSSNFNTDSISDLGDGIINITSTGPSSGTVANRYRFFVMCKNGWNTVRFYGVDYSI